MKSREPITDVNEALLYLYAELGAVRKLMYITLDPATKQNRVEELASLAQYRTRTLVNSLKGKSNG